MARTGSEIPGVGRGPKLVLGQMVSPVLFPYFLFFFFFFFYFLISFISFAFVIQLIQATFRNFLKINAMI
jgi:hypothetical protein